MEGSTTKMEKKKSNYPWYIFKQLVKEREAHTRLWTQPDKRPAAGEGPTIEPCVSVTPHPRRVADRGKETKKGSDKDDT